MLALACHDGVARPRVATERDLVGHHARGDQDCRLLADESGVARLEGVDRRILAIAIVSDDGVGHGGPHGVGGLRDRVASEIDDRRRHRPMVPVTLEHRLAIGSSP